MALPLILSMLGSGLAGAGALSGLGILASPLVAGAIGSGLGTAIQEKDLGAGIRAGLTAGALGGLGSMFAGGAGAATAAGGATAGQMGANGLPGLMTAAPEGAQAGMRGLMQRMPSGAQNVVTGLPSGGFMDAAKQGLSQGVLTGAGLGTALPGAMQAMTPTMPEPEEYTPTYGPAVPFERNAVAAPEDYIPGVSGEHLYFDRYSVPTPARLAEGGQVNSSYRFANLNADDLGRSPINLLQAINDFQVTGVNPITAMRQMATGTYKPPAAAAPAAPVMQRENLGPPPAGYQPGVDPEWMYSRMVPKMAGGGMLRYTPAGMAAPIRMQAGGIADMMPGAEMEEENGTEDYAEDMREMNDKQIVQQAIRAIKGEITESQAAIVLGQFLQAFGEDALRKLVSDVQSGRANGTRGDVEGTVRGPGDGMDDLVPAAMDDGSQDVLLSDGEFVVPADVVSGLGNGSTDAGAEELHRMMDRVRQERTGRTEQAKQIRAGGLMPA